MSAWLRVAKAAWPYARWAVFEGLGLLEKLQEKRRARKEASQPLSYQDVAHQQDQIARATRASAKTVVLPRKP